MRDRGNNTRERYQAKTQASARRPEELAASKTLGSQQAGFSRAKTRHKLHTSVRQCSEQTFFFANTSIAASLLIAAPLAGEKIRLPTRHRA